MMTWFAISCTPPDATGAPYRLTPRPGSDPVEYELPAVSLVADQAGRALPWVDVSISGSDDRRLVAWLRDEWCRHVPVGNPAAAVTPLTRPTPLPADLLAAVTDDVVEVGWTASWGGGFDTLTLRLVLPHGNDQPGPAEASDPGRTPPTSKGFTVIDYGSTATAVTMSFRATIADSQVDPNQAEVLARALAALLGEQAPAGVGDTDWKRVRDALAGQLALRRERRPLAEVQADLEHPGDEDQEVLQSVAAALERVLRNETGPGVEYLEAARDLAYREAFATPATGRFGLFPVTFRHDEEDHPIISSAAHITDLSDLTVKLWHRETPPDGTKVTVRSLKQEFRNIAAPPTLDTLLEFSHLDERVRQAARAHTSADLLTRTFRSLHGAIGRFLSTDERITRRFTTPQEREPFLRHVVVTYPTMTPPDVRENLRTLLSPALGGADLTSSDFDEGVAAALYFTMLAVGATAEIGAEVLRASSQPIRGGVGRRFRRNILVLDIGGGTTDIALVSLVLSEIVVGRDGRRYELRPQVLGATGHPQLGGNYLTLRILYWIKAMLADELLAWEAGVAADGQGPASTGTPGGAGTSAGSGPDAPGADGAGGTARSFAARVLAQGVRKPVPEDVRVVLDELVPTSGADRYPRFMELWNWAERAKRALGERDRTAPFPIPNAQSLVKLPERFARAPQINLELRPEDFHRVVRPVVDRAAEIAADLVVNAFGVEGREDFHLHQVALCGRTTAMPMVREAVVERLSGLELDEHRPLAWNSAAVVVEDRYAKEATSMGVAWAVGFGREERYSRDATAGADAPQVRTGLQVETGALFTQLPCSFELRGALGEKTPVLRIGAPLIAGRRGIRPTARSRWLGLRADVELFRPIDTKLPIRWAGLRIKDHADGLDVTTGRWLGGVAHQGERVRMQIVVDAALTPSVHLSLGRGHLIVDGEGEDVSKDLDRAAPGSPDAGEATPVAWRWPIAAVPIGYPEAEGTVVIPVPADPAAAFPETFFQMTGRGPADLPGRPVAGVLSAVPLPKPDGRLEGWTVYGLLPDGGYTGLCTLQPPPGDPAPGADYLVSLDANGRLRAHLGWPDYLTARSVHDVERRPGAVLTLPMGPGRQDFDHDLYPFNGRH